MSQETAKLVQALSPPTEDIEDLLEPLAKKRKRISDTPTTSISSVSTTKRIKKEVTIKTEITATKAKNTSSKQRRQPAKKIKHEDGSVEIQPPSNWETTYDIVKKMRAANPTAPVDTMGCADLHWRTSPPKEQRFHTLVALMLSSQTKDTVTAVVMQRLHTELGQEAEQTSTTVSPSKNFIKKEEHDDTDDIKLGSEKQGSTLTVQNIIAVSPERLNQIIWAVGFHNNKTKYIKQAAEILRDQYDSDIPPTPEELMKLPGVGPKMAYLCMSAAWGKNLGIGVDVHVHRITNMWGWHVTKNPEETRLALQSWLLGISGMRSISCWLVWGKQPAFLWEGSVVNATLRAQDCVRARLEAW